MLLPAIALSSCVASRGGSIMTSDGASSSEGSSKISQSLPEGPIVLDSSSEISAGDSNVSITEEGFSFTAHSSAFDSSSFLTMAHGGYITNETAIYCVTGIKADYEVSSDLGEVMYRTGLYPIGSPNVDAYALPDDEKVEFDPAPYFSISMPVGECMISSITVYFSETEPHENPSTEIRFYTINDFHGYVEEDDSNDQAGMMKLGSYWREAQKEDPEGMVLISSGDMWQGTASSNLTKGKLVTDWMNLMGFESMAIGNHEFDWGEDVIKTNEGLADFPFLGINVHDSSGARPSWAQASKVVERQGIKIGIIGAIGSLESSIATSSLGGLSFYPDYEKMCSEEAARLREEEGCSLVVVSIHNGAFDTDLCSNIDAVFEGHTHQEYYELDSNGIPHIQMGSYGTYAGYLSFTLQDGEYVYSGKQVDTGSAVISGRSDDEGCQKVYDYYYQEVAPIKNEVLCTLDSGIGRTDLARLAVEQLYDYYLNKGVLGTNCAGAVVNYGGIRTELAAGTLTYGDVYAALPFDNYNDLVSFTGANLKSFINDNCDDVSLYQGHRLVCYQNPDFDLDSASDDGTYTLVIISYVSEYAYYQDLFSEITYRDDYFLREIVADYFRGLAS